MHARCCRRAHPLLPSRTPAAAVAHARCCRRARPLLLSLMLTPPSSLPPQITTASTLSARN
eukprot:53104-Chlamydomonas_euryale.AAC.1